MNPTVVVIVCADRLGVRLLVDRRFAMRLMWLDSVDGRMLMVLTDANGMACPCSRFGRMLVVVVVWMLVDCKFRPAGN